MAREQVTQKTSRFLAQETYLLSWIEAFLIDRKAQNLTPGSVVFYQQKLKIFSDYCEAQALTQIDQITPAFIREFLIVLEERGYTPGGIHCVYRSLKAFLRWYEDEAEPDDWKNPIRKIKQPRVPEEPLEPVELNTVERMIDKCDRRTFTGIRDYALLLFLLDTGTRAKECLAVNVEDVDLITGDILIKQGKGRKPRSVFIQKKARRALRSYLKERSERQPALWITIEGDRLQYGGLRSILERRAAAAGVPVPTAHDFRRAFAINMLRNGVDLITLARLMGHTTTNVLWRYLKQVKGDLSEAHRKGSPVDHMEL